MALSYEGLLNKWFGIFFLSLYGFYICFEVCFCYNEGSFKELFYFLKGWMPTFSSYLSFYHFWRSGSVLLVLFMLLVSFILFTFFPPIIWFWALSWIKIKIPELSEDELSELEELLSCFLCDFLDFLCFLLFFFLYFFIFLFFREDSEDYDSDEDWFFPKL